MKSSSTESELNDCVHVCTRGLLLIFPFIFILILEIFVLPIDFFTFRIWEAALSKPYQYPAPFFPNLHIIKKEEFGDFYRYGIKEAKTVEWFTDKFGWRNRPEVEKRDKYDAIVIGDSNIVGSFLDQKDTLAEVLSRRTNKTVYSYASANDNISLFFSDPRPVLKTAGLLVFEVKADYWITNNVGLYNFTKMPDETLKLKDRSLEFLNYYAQARNFTWEKIKSRSYKLALWHKLRAALSIDYVTSSDKNLDVYTGKKTNASLGTKKSWRPLKGFVKNSLFHTLANEPQPALALRKNGRESYWHTDKFVSSSHNGEIKIRFDAKNSITTSKHIMWIFENGVYRPIGEIFAESNWRTFEIDLKTQPGSILEFQIDQADNWQWLSIRNVNIVNGQSPSASVLQLQANKISHPISAYELSGKIKPKIPAFDPSHHPTNLTPLDGTNRSITIEESQYYFYHAMKVLQSKASERNMDFICFVMPTEHLFKLMPAIRQLRSEGVKVLTYEPTKNWSSGVKKTWYWQKADTHWREAAVRLTADEIARMWNTKIVANRHFSPFLMAAYANDFPKQSFSTACN